jgi:hypothetical protein
MEVYWQTSISELTRHYQIQQNTVCYFPYPRTTKQIDSLTLRFSAGQRVIAVYRESTSYIWKDTSFYRKDNEIVLKIPEAGWYGLSTITLEFILNSFDAGYLSLVAEVTMHKMAPFQLTSQKAQVDFDIAIP